MSMLIRVPEELWTLEKEDEFFSWLWAQEWPISLKRYVLIDWIDFVGAEKKAEHFVRAGIQ